MEQTLIDKIINMLTPLSAKVKCFYLSGSRSLEFIKHYNDYDIIVLCETIEDCRDCSRYMRANHGNQNKLDGLNFHFIREFKDSGDWGKSLYPFLLKDRTYYNLDSSTFTRTITIDKFLEKRDNIKNKYITTIEDVKTHSLRESDPDSFFYDRKLWYYLYVTVAILLNRSWDLTDEQIDAVNLLHDVAEDTYDRRKALVDQLIKNIEAL